MNPPARLFTPRFFVMCGFTFTVFLSAFMLLPSMPFRILALGGGKFQAGLFLGFLTYSSALSAPLTGALADRLGKRSVLVASSLAIAGFSAAYGLTSDYRLPLALVLVHGVFWSALLSASAAYMTDIIPEARRAEGISYWGMATILAIAFAPAVGFWLYQHGWGWLCAASAGFNLLMTGIALCLREAPVRAAWSPAHSTRDLIEWRVVGISVTLFLYSFGYGGITSFVALYADASGVMPKSIFFTVFSLVVLATRPLSGPLADRIGHRKVLLPCLGLVAVGLGLLAAPWATTRTGMIAAAAVFGAGFGTAYPVFAAIILARVDPARRGAAFGGILAAFDTGIGTGSVTLGWVISRLGYAPAFGLAALLASLSLPYFLWAERRFLTPAGSRSALTA